jgi:hypothetical protein
MSATVIRHRDGSVTRDSQTIGRIERVLDYSGSTVRVAFKVRTANNESLGTFYSLKLAKNRLNLLAD